MFYKTRKEDYYEKFSKYEWKFTFVHSIFVK